MEFLSGARSSLNPISFANEVNREFLYLFTSTCSGHACAAGDPLRIQQKAVSMPEA